MQIGMISTRFAGLDGVSLEAAKLAPVIREAGHEVSWFAGELGDNFSPGVQLPAAHFATEENLAIEARAFASNGPDEELADLIRRRAAELKPALIEFLSTVDVAYVHNALSIPMQLPLAVAITEALAETQSRAVAHHHDFAWERPRFSRCRVPEILEGYFPPLSSGISHTVINSIAKQALANRTGADATLLPNILDFESGPEGPGEGSRYRAAAGIDENKTILLQPTRIIERKGIEHTIELAAALDTETVVVFSHAADRDEAYWTKLVSLAGEKGVTTVYAPVGPNVDSTLDLPDAFAAADLVCFPSLVEGFGNALVECLFYRRPLFVNRYDVYVADIAPMGIEAIEMDGQLTPDVVAQVEFLLRSQRDQVMMAEHNYQVGLQHMSHRVIRDRLLPLLGHGD